MSKTRLFLMLFGPVPIVLLSIGVSRWARSDPESELVQNQVIRVAKESHDATGPQRRETRRPQAALFESCRDRADLWQRKLGGDCTVIVRPPFIVAGDLSPQQLEQWYVTTIEPAARAMADNYFQVPPYEPVSVLLFSGETSYNHYTDVLFGERGVSVYGYYKPGRRTLVMNIGTGGGTLVHELTHALIDFDFPAVPDWFNEGLASLHEQCRFRESPQGPWIEGLVNWRLPILQQEIRRGAQRSLADLIRDDDFRGAREGVNYAQARYFCMFMQQAGVLPEYYRQIKANRSRDPQGLEAVSAVFSDKSWAELDEEFRKWALSLEW